MGASGRRAATLRTPRGDLGPRWRRRSSASAAPRWALAHAIAHVQFGKPIAAFQAVRHRLAEAHVAVAAARSALEASVSAAGEPGGGAWAARLAKVRAGRTQAEVLRHTRQVLAAQVCSRVTLLRLSRSSVTLLRCGRCPGAGAGRVKAS